jgi:hypothetical protein
LPLEFTDFSFFSLALIGRERRHADWIELNSFAVWKGEMSR